MNREAPMGSTEASELAPRRQIWPAAAFAERDIGRPVCSAWPHACSPVRRPHGLAPRSSRSTGGGGSDDEVRLPEDVLSSSSGGGDEPSVAGSALLPSLDEVSRVGTWITTRIKDAPPQIAASAS